MRREIRLLKNEGVCDPRIFAHRMILCTRGGIAPKAMFGPKQIGVHVEDFENRACAFFFFAFHSDHMKSPKKGPKNAMEPTTTSSTAFGKHENYEGEMGV